MASVVSPQTPIGPLSWEDGFEAGALTLRASKAYLAGYIVSLVSANTVEVLRVRYGGFDHRQTTDAGTQLISAVGPPGQYVLLAESIRLREGGFLIRGKYKRNMAPVFRFFARVTVEQDWGH